MLWRSPWEAAAKNSTNNDFFSRDQGLAALAAFTRSKNASLYEPWLKYITGHQGCMCPNRPYGKGNFCKLFVGDCNLEAPFWCTFDHVAQFANLTRPPPEDMSPKFKPGFCNNEHLVIYTSCAFNENGSGLHLAAVDVYIRRLTGTWDKTLQAAADKLHSRDPNNAFFYWLSKGASDDLAELIISQVPADGNHSKHQWSFCRADAGEAWKESMGWEFIFLIDHLLAV